MTPRIDFTKHMNTGLARAMFGRSRSRLSVSFRPPVGSYQPAAAEAAV